MSETKMLSFAGIRSKLGGDQAPCRRTLERMIERGEFVQPVRVTPRRVLFVEADVDAWIELRKLQQSKSKEG